MINYNQIQQAGNLLSTLGNLNSTPSLNFQNKKDILTVNGLQEARDFKLNNGENVILMDCNNDIIYVKRCDDIGKVTLNVYECKDVTDTYEKQNTPANISKADFDNLVKSISELKNYINKGVQNEYNAKK